MAFKNSTESWLHTHYNQVQLIPHDHPHVEEHIQQQNKDINIIKHKKLSTKPIINNTQYNISNKLLKKTQDNDTRSIIDKICKTMENETRLKISRTNKSIQNKIEVTTNHSRHSKQPIETAKRIHIKSIDQRQLKNKKIKYYTTSGACSTNKLKNSTDSEGGQQK